MCKVLRLVNEATDFAGTNGCYLYQGRDVQERKNKHLKDQILVLAPSEGLVSSDTWLRCRKKLMANKTFQGGRKAKNTWLAGKVKCGRCGYALMSVGNPTGVQYLRCSKRADSKSCDGCGTLRTREFERFLYGEMVKKLSEFQTLTAKRETVNPKLTALESVLLQLGGEELGSGAANDGIGAGHLLNGGIGGFFQLQPLGDALLNKVGSLDCLLQVVGKLAVG